MTEGAGITSALPPLSRLGWHFCIGARPRTMRGRPPLRVRVGQTLSIHGGGIVEMCSRGLHASPTIYSAGDYIVRFKGKKRKRVLWICRVRVDRVVETQKDKFVGWQRTCLFMARIDTWPTESRLSRVARAKQALSRAGYSWKTGKPLKRRRKAA